MQRKLLRLPKVEEITGIKKSKIYSLISMNKFPRQILITDRAVGWDSESIARWVSEKINEKELQ